MKKNNIQETKSVSGRGNVRGSIPCSDSSLVINSQQKSPKSEKLDEMPNYETLNGVAPVSPKEEYISKKGTTKDNNSFHSADVFIQIDKHLEGVNGKLLKGRYSDYNSFDIMENIFKLQTFLICLEDNLKEIEKDILKKVKWMSDTSFAQGYFFQATEKKHHSEVEKLKELNKDILKYLDELQEKKKKTEEYIIKIKEKIE